MGDGVRASSARSVCLQLSDLGQQGPDLLLHRVILPPRVLGFRMTRVRYGSGVVAAPLAGGRVCVSPAILVRRGGHAFLAVDFRVSVSGDRKSKDDRACPYMRVLRRWSNTVEIVKRGWKSSPYASVDFSEKWVVIGSCPHFPSLKPRNTLTLGNPDEPESGRRLLWRSP